MYFVLYIYIGNCLFYALSDQIYGHQGEHANIRAAVIEYMRQNANDFKYFIPVIGGGRRNPKRKNVGALSGPISCANPTEDAVNQKFEAYLLDMARNGTYGDNLEIVAFAKAFSTNVRIYQAHDPLMIYAADDWTALPVAHIAHHVSFPVC